MTTITRSSLVMYSPDQMFDLVNDVEAYPSFLPWCRDSKIISKNDKVICATLDIAKGGIHHEFSTRNTLQHGESIRIELIDGPFRHLEGFCQFSPIGDNEGCRVQLDMDFEFSTRLLDLALGPVFTQISGSLVEAFCVRAREIYGSGILERYPQINLETDKVGIFGKICKLNATLSPKDRIEIYRPLIADPKESRRQKAEMEKKNKAAEAAND